MVKQNTLFRVPSGDSIPGTLLLNQLYCRSQADCLSLSLFFLFSLLIPSVRAFIAKVSYLAGEMAQ